MRQPTPAPPSPRLVIHRVNRHHVLADLPRQYGTEIDIRAHGNRLLLSHDPVADPDALEDLDTYLSHYRHDLLVCNIKEAGIEAKVLEALRRHRVNAYFLLDVEFPYLFRATRREGIRDIAVRFSEAEPIEAVEAQIEKGRPLLDWVWIDTITRLPLDERIVAKLRPFRTCLVCPERWGRPEDIPRYRARMAELGFIPDAVMTSLDQVPAWTSP